MILDASLLTLEEKLYWDLPEVVLSDFEQTGDLDPEIEHSLEELARYSMDPDRFPEQIAALMNRVAGFQSAGVTYEEYLQLMLSR
jgi:hypothetical protein